MAVNLLPLHEVPYHQPQQGLRALNTALIGEDATVWIGSDPTAIYTSEGRIEGSNTGARTARHRSGNTGQSWANVAAAGMDFGVRRPMSTGTSGNTTLVLASIEATRAYVMVSQGEPSLNARIYLSANLYWWGGDRLGALSLIEGTEGGFLSQVIATDQFDGQTHCWVVSNIGGSSVHRDGVLQALAAGDTRTTTDNSTIHRFKVGGHATTTGLGLNTSDPLHMVVTWPRGIPMELRQYLSENPHAIWADEESFLVVDAGGGSSPVTTDLTASFGILSSASQDLTGSYSVVNSASQDLAGSYGVSESTSQDLTASFAVAGVALAAPDSYSATGVPTLYAGMLAP